VSGLLVGLLKVAFLAVIWLFIASVAGVIKSDLFGAKAGTGALAAQPNPKRRGSRRTAQLLVTNGPGQGDAVPLTGEIIVGRAPDATLDIVDDFASGHHARFYSDNESWIVADLQSTNGTVINGLRIGRPTRVGNGDMVRIGRTLLRVEEP